MTSDPKEKEGSAPHDGDPEDVDPKSQAYSLEQAQAASAAEHETTFKQAVRESWKAALWSAVISLTIVMKGYDQRLAVSNPR